MNIELELDTFESYDLHKLHRFKEYLSLLDEKTIRDIVKHLNDDIKTLQYNIQNMSCENNMYRHFTYKLNNSKKSLLYIYKCI